MRPERWRQIERLYHAALEREASRRADFLAETCMGDEALRLKVESLLAYEEQAKDFIETPAYVFGAELFAETTDETVIGERLGPYRILSPIGAGGMGEVYLAQDTRLGRRVALKLLPARFTTDTDRVRRFAWEARAASALNHPNIITIYDIGNISGAHFIATEFIEGQTLRQRMATGGLTFLTSVELAIQIASALDSAHEAGIIHRDIKPENVMVRPDGLVKVLDFGLAKLTERQTTAIDRQASTVVGTETEAGAVMGTARYMSPEQARGLKVDPRTDIFSLGVALYEMIAGHAPFTGPSACDVIAALLQHEPVPLTRHSPEAPAELERIVSKALRKDREERYQTINDLLVDLKGLKQELEFEARSDLANRPMAGGGRRAIEPFPGPAARRAPGAASLVRSLVSGIVRHKQGVVAALATLAIALAGIAYFGLAHQYIGRSYEQKRMYQEAVAEYLKGRTLQRGDSPEIIETLREAYRISGWRGYLMKALDLALAKERAKKEPVSALGVAELYTRLGEKDSALVWLERAYQERDDRLVALKADPRFDNLRSDPRFDGLLRRVGLAR